MRRIDLRLVAAALSFTGVAAAIAFHLLWLWVTVTQASFGTMPAMVGVWSVLLVVAGALLATYLDRDDDA